MTEEEKKVADAKALADAEVAKQAVEAKNKAEAEADALAIAEKDNKIKKLEEERDNYKAVALKRLGKLEGDADFMAGTNDSGEMSVAEQVRLALLDREIEIERKAKDDEMKRVLRENSELKLALKNRPDVSMDGGEGSGGAGEVKDNVFSVSQIAEMEKRAKRLNIDPVKYIENAKKNLSKAPMR
jgi:hypothetical protein